MENKIFSVSEINNYIKNILDSDALLNEIYISGELSNYKIYPSGHHYFTMKDQEGALRCVMFRGSAAKLRFHPENGMKVIAFGRISVFPRDGAYQLYVNSLTSDGLGDLHVAFEQLKEKLYREGMFDESLKKEIPKYPERIAVITSPAGAAVRDIIRVLGARYPLAKVIVLPVRVQGAEAVAEIEGAIRYANKYHVADVIITGRGGGSLEDLWAFNEERVVRAIFHSEIPVISAVGHEPDVTISDFAADLRAATPSNAAELAVPDVTELQEMLFSASARIAQALKRELTINRGKLEELQSRRVMQSPLNYIDDKRMLLDRMQERLISTAMGTIASGKQKYVELASKLDAMSPLKVLGRGYAIAIQEDGMVVKTAKDVKSGDKITLHLQKDNIHCTVD